MTQTTDALPTPNSGERALGPARGARAALRRETASVRTRILAGYVLLLALTVIGSFLVARQVLILQLDERIDAELVQETRELRELATGRDPQTGAPFGDRIRRIFRAYLERNFPSRNEAHLTFVDGRTFLRSRRVVPYRIDRDAELVRRWAGLTAPDRGRADTPAGRLEYLAVPLQTGGSTLGVFVVAVFRDRERGELDSAVAATGAVGLAVLLIGSVLFWRLAEGIRRPVRLVSRTARAISEADLTRRISVQGDDEVAELAGTFNEMLDRLEDAFATQRRFLDDAGHELRTPITIVRGHLELLDDDPDERRAALALVMDELDRMSRMVNDLLLLAKAEQPDFLELSTVDVGTLTTELLAKSEALATREWRLERRGRGVIVADRQRLTQALVQLAQNAVQHTDDGDPIALGSAIENGDARFWVRDSGPGLPESEQRTVFGRFARGAESGREEGAGLGLAIVEAIARAHHGRIELDSRPGAGATFTLVVPVDQPLEDGGDT